MKGMLGNYFGCGKCRYLAGVVFLITLFTHTLVFAVPIVPVSYVATPGEGMAQGGTFNYFDDTGSQLTDGMYGVNDWRTDLGNGPAYEWVGWKVADPTITFTFSSSVTIDQVGIDFNRDEEADASIFLPPTVTINGMNFSVDPNAIPDMTRGTVDFNGSWTGTTLTVTLTDGDPTRWIFVDEMPFDAVPVPEPSGIALVLSGLGWWLARGRGRGRNASIKT
jgi:hypothetical protein